MHTTITRGSDVFRKDTDAPWEDLGNGIRRKLLTYNGELMLLRIAFAAGAVGAPHSHPHIQCSVVESGAFDVTIGGRTERLRAGDSFIVPSQALHGAVCVEAGVLVDVFTPMREDFLK
jgi:quercetin dioxygenase-like cupin family protein